MARRVLPVDGPADRGRPLSADAGYWDRVAAEDDALEALRGGAADSRADAAADGAAARVLALPAVRGAWLDLGCGDGRVAVRTAPHVRRLIALDTSPGMLARATRRARALANVAVVLGDGRRWCGVEDASLDCVYGLLVLTGAPRREAAAAFAETRRTLREDGVAYFELLDAHAPQADRTAARARALGIPAVFWSEGEIRALLRATGLAVAALTRRAPYWDVIARVARAAPAPIAGGC